MQYTIRAAAPDDLPALVELYNHYIVHSPATFDLVPHTVDERRPWFDAFAPHGRHRMLVAEATAPHGEVAAGRLVGFSSSRQFRPKAAYDPSVEASVYVAHEALGHGIGGALYTELLPIVSAEPEVHRVLAGITLPNEASVSLHERFGFERIGVFSEVGLKFGRYWDVAWYELDVEAERGDGAA